MSVKVDWGLTEVISVLRLWAIGLLAVVATGMAILFAKVRETSPHDQEPPGRTQARNPLYEFIHFWREASKPEFQRVLDSLGASDLLRIWRLTRLTGDVLFFTVYMLVLLEGTHQAVRGSFAGLFISLLGVLAVSATWCHVRLVRKVGSWQGKDGRGSPRGDVENSSGAPCGPVLAYFRVLSLALGPRLDSPLPSSMRWLARLTLFLEVLLFGMVLLSFVLWFPLS